MYSADKDEFAKIMTDLCTMFGRRYSPELARVYFDTLSELTIDSFRERAGKWKRTGKTFPKPADLLDVHTHTPYRPVGPKSEEGPDISPWARYANRYLLHVIAKKGGLGDLLPDVLAAKREIVHTAEDDAATGEPWEDQDFISVIQATIDRAATREAA